MKKRSVRLLSFVLCAVMTVELLLGNGLLANAAEVSADGEEQCEEVIGVSEEQTEKVSEEVSEEPIESETLVPMENDESEETDTEDITEVTSEQETESEDITSEDVEELDSENTEALISDEVERTVEEELVGKGEEKIPATAIHITPEGELYPSEEMTLEVTMMPENTDEKVVYYITYSVDGESATNNLYPNDAELDTKNFYLKREADGITVTSKLPEDAKNEETILIGACTESTFGIEGVDMIASNSLITLKPYVYITDISFDSDTYTVCESIDDGVATSYYMVRPMFNVMPRNANYEMIRWKCKVGTTPMTIDEIVAYEMTNDEEKIVIDNSDGYNNIFRIPAEMFRENDVTFFAYALTYDEEGNKKYVGAQCTVTSEKEPDTAPMPTVKGAICSNVYPTLGTISLDNGWKWVDPSTSLTRYTGKCSFPIEYVGTEYKKTQKEFEIEIYSAKPITIEGTSSVSCDSDGKGLFSDIQVSPVKGEKDEVIPTESYKVKYKVAKNSIIESVKLDDKEYISNASQYSVFREASKISVKTKKSGTFNVMVNVEFYRDSKVTNTISVTKAFTVYDSKFQSVTISNESGINCNIPEKALEEKDITNGALIEYIPTKTQTVTIKAYDNASGGYESKVETPVFKFSSSNNKVASIGRVTTKEGISTATVTIKGSGEVFITATGNDSLKSSKTVRLNVYNGSITVGKQQAVFDTLRTESTYGVEYKLTASNYVVIDKVEITNTLADNFEVQCKTTEEGDRFLFVSLKKSETTGSVRENSFYGKAKLSESIPVHIKYEVMDELREEDVTLKLTGKAITPKFSVKQVQKLNLFNIKSTGRMTVTSSTGANVEALQYKLKDCDYCLSSDKAIEEQGSYYLTYSCSPNTSGQDKSGTLVIKDADITIGTVKVTIGAETIPEKLKTEQKSLTMYTGIGQTERRTKIVKTDGSPTNFSLYARIEQTSGEELFTVNRKYLNSAEFEICLSKGNTSKKSGKVTFTIQEYNWRTPITLSINVQTSKKAPTLKCSPSTLKMNCNELYVHNEVALVEFTASDFEISNIKISGANAASKGILEGSLKHWCEASTYFFCFKSKGNIKPGTYKFKVTATIEDADYIEVSTYLTLKVVNQVKSVKVKTEGVINLYDREGSGIVVTPIYKGVDNPEYYTQYVTCSGPDADMFDIETDNYTLLRIKAKKDGKYYLKKQYHIVIEYVFVNDLGTSKIKTDFKFKVKAPAKKPIVKCSTIQYNGDGSPKQLMLIKNVFSKGNDEESASIVLQQNGLFKCVWSEFQGCDMAFALKVDEVIKLQSGKTYTVSIEIKDKNDPLDGKPLVVKVPFKVEL